MKEVIFVIIAILILIGVIINFRMKRAAEEADRAWDRELRRLGIRRD